MNPVKAQIKIGTVNELGNKFDDKLEALQKDVTRTEGVQAALKEIATSTIPSIMERVDADRDEEKFDLATGALIKDYLAKVVAAIDNLKIRNEKLRLISEGRVAGLKDAITLAKKMYDTEISKLEALQEGLANGAIQVEDAIEGVRPEGMRPETLSPLEDIEQRRAEAKRAKEAKAKESEETQAAPASMNGKAPVKKKRGRPPGSKNKSRVNVQS